MLPSLRQLLAICFCWALVAWICATALVLRASDRSLAEALTWYYAVRAPFIGAILAGIWAPALGVDVGSWASGRFPRRAALARALANMLQGALTGLFIGVFGTFFLLFFWPNDMQSSRWDALKWTLFYWHSHTVLMLPASLLTGVFSGWLSRRLAAGEPDPNRHASEYMP